MRKRSLNPGLPYPGIFCGMFLEIIPSDDFRRLGMAQDGIKIVDACIADVYGWRVLENVEQFRQVAFLGRMHDAH